MYALRICSNCWHQFPSSIDKVLHSTLIVLTCVIVFRGSHDHYCNIQSMQPLFVEIITCSEFIVQRKKLALCSCSGELKAQILILDINYCVAKTKFHIIL